MPAELAGAGFRPRAALRYEAAVLLRRLPPAALTASCFALLVSRGARADPPPAALRITYHAPDGCPSESAFSSQILARTHKARLATPGESRSRALDITITQRDGGFSGRLELADQRGRFSHRNVSGDTCKDVVAALALVTALTLDPMASTRPIPPAPGAKSAAPPPRAARPVPVPAPVRRPAPAPLWRAPAPPPPRPPWHVSVGGDVAVRGGAAPRAVLALPVFVEVGMPRGGPSLRASFESSLQTTLQVGAAAAAFRWTAGTLEGCPLSWSALGFRVAPCLRVEAGVLEAQGEHISPRENAHPLWVALGATVRTEWSFLPPAFADAGAGVVVPFTRDHFYFQPDPPFYTPAAVGWLARVGLGVRFP